MLYKYAYADNETEYAKVATVIPHPGVSYLRLRRDFDLCLLCCVITAACLQQLPVLVMQDDGMESDRVGRHWKSSIRFGLR